MTPTFRMDEDKQTARLTLRGLFLRLWPWIWQERRWAVISVILVVAFAASGRLLPFVFARAVDVGIAKSDLRAIYLASAVYLFLHIARTVFEFSQTFVMEKLGNRVMFKVREQALAHVQKLPMSYFDRNYTGRIVNRLTTDVLSLGELFNQGFTAIFVNILELTTIIASMLFISPYLTIITLVVSPVAVKLAQRISGRLRGYFSESKRRMAMLAGFTTESLSGMRVLRLFDQTEARTARFERLSQDYRDAQLKTVKQFSMLWPILSFFNLATITSSLFFAGIFWDRLGMSVGELTAFLLLVQGFYAPIRIMIERYNQFQNSLAGADRIFGLLEEPAEPARGKKVDSLKGEVRFEDVTFQYQPEAEPALKNVTVHIHPGESVALVGRTGSGKTTFTNLLMKFYPLVRGKILIDGERIEDLETASLRRRMALVQQDNFIFRGTLKENIGLGDPAVTEADIRQAVATAGIEPLVDKLGGLDAKIEERGQNLSVGERQLVSFARALAFNPDMLILDEATSNIDSHSESLIKDATASITKGRTSLIIAHRLSTVIHCDRILVFDGGKVVEEGAHSQLLKHGGVYAELYESGLK